MTEIYYRLVDSMTVNNKPCISCIRFKVVRRTEKGAWIIPTVWYNDNPKERFVLDGEGKRFAHATFELARHSYEMRKLRQVKILNAQLDRAMTRAKIATRLIEQMTSDVRLQYSPEPCPLLESPPVPHAFREIHDNPISPRTWSLDRDHP